MFLLSTFPIKPPTFVVLLTLLANDHCKKKENIKHYMVTVRFVPRESHKNMYTQAEISISFGPPKTKKRCKVAKEAAN